MKPLAPIIIFVYKRQNTLQKTIDALKKCDLSQQSELFIFSDGYKNDSDKLNVLEVRNYIDSITGFKNITIYKSQNNKGLATSIIEGVSLIFKNYQSVIVLEDDINTSSNFLLYMNECLNTYEDNLQVFSISGYRYPIKMPKNYPHDVFFLPRGGSWGWGSWRNRWVLIDWEIKDFNKFKNDRKQIRDFKAGGADLFKMLKYQMKGKIDSWAIRWFYNQYKMKSYSIHPVISKTQNIGFGIDASNTKGYNRYFTPMDEELKAKFNLPNTIILDKYLIRQFQDFFSLKSRLIGRLNTILYIIGLVKNK